LFYDRPGVAARYGVHRHGGVSSPNFVMEEPALLAELGDVAGLDVLDLGCGDAALGAMLLQQGCASYLGVDGSQEMVTLARITLEDPRGTVALQNMEELSLPAGTVDLVVSRLALHYLEDLDPVLRACHAVLRPGGRLCFSVLHPVITSSDVQSSPGPRGSWTVDDYFLGGARERVWMGDTVTWFHRTIEQYVGAVTGAGFNLTALRECEPEPGRFGGDEAELARRRRVPLFLLLSARAS
jgi:SAM-dependent methyltransferase